MQGPRPVGGECGRDELRRAEARERLRVRRERGFPVLPAFHSVDQVPPHLLNDAWVGDEVPSELLPQALQVRFHVRRRHRCPPTTAFTA